MNNSKLTNIILILLLIFNVSFLGSWWYGHWKAHRKNRHELCGHSTKCAKFLINDLALSSSQQDQLQVLSNSYFMKMQKLETLVAGYDKSLVNLLSRNPADSISANQYADSVGNAKAIMRKEMFRHLSEIRKICTPVQAAKFDELMQKSAEEFPHHRMECGGKEGRDTISK